MQTWRRTPRRWSKLGQACRQLLGFWCPTWRQPGYPNGGNILCRPKGFRSTPLSLLGRFHRFSFIDGLKVASDCLLPFAINLQFSLHIWLQRHHFVWVASYKHSLPRALCCFGAVEFGEDSKSSLKMSLWSNQINNHSWAIFGKQNPTSMSFYWCCHSVIQSLEGVSVAQQHLWWC